MGGIMTPFVAIGSIFSYDNGPIQGYQQHLLVESLGPFVAIGSIFSSNNRPIQGYRHHLLVESLGPFMAIDNILQHHQWVQLRVLAAYIARDTGPIRGHWQHLFSSTNGLL